MLLQVPDKFSREKLWEDQHEGSEPPAWMQEWGALGYPKLDGLASVLFAPFLCNGSSEFLLKWGKRVRETEEFLHGHHDSSGEELEGCVQGQRL